jgi:hypothetical protein
VVTILLAVGVEEVVGFSLSKELNRNFVGFAFYCSRLGEVLCNLLRGKGREFERILKLVGDFCLQGTSSGPERAGKSYLIFLVSAIFCEGRKCSEVREAAVLRMVSSMALQEGVRS